MNKSTWESTVKPVVVLSVIALVVSFLLALVNSFTAPIIEETRRPPLWQLTWTSCPPFPTPRRWKK